MLTFSSSNCIDVVYYLVVILSSVHLIGMHLKELLLPCWHCSPRFTR